MNTYLSQFDYIRSPAGLEYASLLGNSMRLSGVLTAGGTTLNVTPSTTVQLNPNDRITIFDGPNSEVVVVNTQTGVGASNIPLMSPGLQYGHAQNVACCSDGILGSLADQIVDASAELESIAYQSLFQATYAGEVLQIPSMDASIDNQRMLLFRPKRIPVTTVTALQLNAIQSQAFVLDATQAFIDVAGQYVRVPVFNATGPSSQVFFPQQPFNRTQKQWLTISYTAGFAPSALPADIKDAAVLLTSSILSRRQNPTGADQINLIGKQLTAVIRGDFSGEDLWFKQARRKIAKYARRAL